MALDEACGCSVNVGVCVCVKLAAYLQCLAIIIIFTCLILRSVAVESAWVQRVASSLNCDSLARSSELQAVHKHIHECISVCVCMQAANCTYQHMLHATCHMPLKQAGKCHKASVRVCMLTVSILGCSLNIIAHFLQHICGTATALSSYHSRNH